VTLAVSTLYVIGLYSTTVASWLLTVFVIWSPWHYAGQNYGLAVIFLPRRGVPLARSTKSLLHASFVLSYVLLLLILFTGDESGEGVARDYGASGSEKIRIQSLGIPAEVGMLTAPVTVAYMVVTIIAAIRLLGRARARDLLPSGLLVASQALWFSLPMLVRFTGVGTGVDPLNPDLRASYFIWIALAHAAQYLWVTSYYARATPEWHGTSNFVIKAAVAGTALWTLPLLAFAPLDAMVADAGFYMLLSSCINIHHFILDGAIWKLRDSRVANVLLRDPSSARASRKSRRPWLRRLVWGVATGGAVLAIAQFQFEAQLTNASSQGQLARASVALDNLDWFGRDSARARRLLAKAYVEAGDSDAAIAELTRSLDLALNIAGYSELAHLEGARGDVRASLAALEAGLALDPDRLGLLHRAGEAQLALGRPDLARATLERALAVDPRHAPSMIALWKARRAAAQTRDSP
jgi:hypothetical protein